MRAARRLPEQSEGWRPGPYAFTMDRAASKSRSKCARERLRLIDQLQKVPTGIQGLDELTRGGLPAGRPTLVCGGPGCGKTLLGITFLVHGAVDHG
jgi:RecA/RadA recombinase